MYRSVKPLEALHPLQMYLQQTSILHAQYKSYNPTHGRLPLGADRHTYIVLLVIWEYLTQAHLVNDGIVVSATFIVHAPTSIRKLKLFILDKSFHLANRGRVGESITMIVPFKRHRHIESEIYKLAVSLVAAVCSFHHRVKKAIST